MLTVLVNFGYGMMLFALLARDVLWLRTILIVGQGALCVYCVLSGTYNIAAWNAVFVVINSVRAAQILRERRPVKLAEPLAQLHKQRFSAMQPAEFQIFWQRGSSRLLHDEILLFQGQKNADLYCVVEGEMEVDIDGRDVAHLPTGSLLGEMSLLTGDVISADVRSIGDATVHCWSAEVLADLQRRNPPKWEQLKSVIGGDLVEKIKRASKVAE